MGISIKRLAASTCVWVLAAACAALVASSGAPADPFPKGAQAKNVKQIGFSALGGRFGGFKIAIKHTANDKWYLYTGHSFDQGWSIVDVTDPANPRYVKFIPYVTDDKSIITAQVTLHDNLMITSLNSFKPQTNPLPAVLLWDISDPENPKQVGSWKGGATGAHRNSYPGGKYAYLSTSYPGFKAAHHGDPGRQRSGAPERGRQMVAAGPEGRRAAVAVSGRLPRARQCQPRRQDGVVRLHARRGQSRHFRPGQPEADRQLHITSPFASVGTQSVHTVLPLWDRNLLYVSSEAQKGSAGTTA